MKKLLSIIALFGFVATTMVPTYAAPAEGKAVGGGTDNKGKDKRITTIKIINILKNIYMLNLAC